MPGHDPRHILIVSADVLMRWAVAETLTREGHTVIQATDAVSAIRAIRHASPAVEVVFLDDNPSFDAHFGLPATMRRLSPATAICLMTAHGTPQVIEAARAQGVAHLVEKPIDMDALPAIVDHLTADRGNS